MKIIFGELEQSIGSVEQHTAVTIPWTAAKLLIYYLATQVVAHEIANGKIVIPPGVMPPEPPALLDEHKGNKTIEKMQAKFKELYAQFIKEL